MEIGVTLGGGEPTVHSKFEELVRKCRELSKYLTLSTNGKNVKKVLSISENLDGVAVSAPFIYNPALMKGMYQLSPTTIADTINELSKHVSNVCATVIVTKKMRVADVGKVLSWAKSAGANYVLFALYKPYGRGIDYEKMLFPPLQQARNILCEAVRRAVKNKSNILFDSCLLRYTIGKSCPDVFGKLLTADRWDIVTSRVCPRGKYKLCPFDALRQSQVCKQ